MTLFDRKPQIINGRIIFSPKDLSSGEKSVLIAVKLFHILAIFSASCVVIGGLANMIRITFEFPWSWGLFFMWGIVAGFLYAITIAIKFISWWWITDEEAQKYRNYHAHVASQMEGFMKDNAVDYEPISQQDTTKKIDGDKKANVIPLHTRKKPNGEDDEKN